MIIIVPNFRVRACALTGMNMGLPLRDDICSEKGLAALNPDRRTIFG